MDNKKIMVSICCLTYNQEKYVRKTLDCLLQQKTEFDYEILIHDDASTDSTPLILKEYQIKFPEKIHLLLQKENQYSQGKKISWEYQFIYTKGKYIALCEGDDYWNDEYKLQKQYNAMINHPECSICVHKVAWMNELGEYIGKEFPPQKMKPGVLTIEEFLESEAGRIQWTFQTCSYFFRKKYVIDMWSEKPQFFMHAIAGDLPLMLYLVNRGSIFYIPEVMGMYRCNSMYSMTRDNLSNKLKHFKNLIECMTYFNSYTQYKYDNYLINYINHYEFELFRAEKKYEKFCDIKYKNELYKLSFIKRNYYRLLAKFPAFQVCGNIYNKFKDIKK